MISSPVCFWINYIFIWHDILLMLLTKPRTFNISVDSAPLNNALSLLPQLSKIIERTSVLSKIYHYSGFLNFLYLLSWMQEIFLLSPI